MNPVSYLKEVNQELQRVTWPSREKTIAMTALVIGVSLVIAVYIAGIDFMFQQGVTFLLQR
jgi:preprotein translocase subunit SecE